MKKRVRLLKIIKYRNYKKFGGKAAIRGTLWKLFIERKITIRKREKSHISRFPTLFFSCVGSFESMPLFSAFPILYAHPLLFLEEEVIIKIYISFIRKR
jgi:hypothetical protein